MSNFGRDLPAQMIRWALVSALVVITLSAALPSGLDAMWIEWDLLDSRPGYGIALKQREAFPEPFIVSGRNRFPQQQPAGTEWAIIRMLTVVRGAATCGLLLAIAVAAYMSYRRGAFPLWLRLRHPAIITLALWIGLNAAAMAITLTLTYATWLRLPIRETNRTVSIAMWTTEAATVAIYATLAWALIAARPAARKQSDG